MDPVSILSGLIVNKAVDIILKKTAFPYIDRKALENEFHKIMNNAIRKTADGQFAEYFIREKGSIDDSFWKNEKVVEELWGTFTDIENTASVPDFTVLYEEYYKIYTKGWIAPKPFEKVIDVFWTNFLEEARKSELLYSFFERKIIFQLDESVYPSKGLEMIREYCKNIKGKLEEELFNKFTPFSHIKAETLFSEEKIKEEFFDYHRTQMAYVKIGERGYETEKIIDGDEYLKEKKLIIVGDGGIGKTRFMSEVEKKLVSDVASSASDPEYLPFYISAKEINTYDVVALCKTKIEESLDLKKYTDKKIEGFIRYLKIYRKLFPLIDAFDQITPGQENTICKLLSSSALFGECRCFITTRPYGHKQLLDGIKDCGAKEDTFKVVEMRPFTIEELPRYFKGYYAKVEKVIDKLGSRRDKEINLIQIPMFAELVKVMAMKDKLDPEAITANNRAWLLKKFVDFIIGEQVKKDSSPPRAKKHKEAEYSAMLKTIEKFSLRALEDEKIYEFEREYAQHVLGDDYKIYWPLMISTQFIYFFDYESIESLEEKMHRYRHQIFQEYFAAKRLYSQRRYNVESMRLSMQKMEYMPEVGRFLSDLYLKKWTQG